MGRGRGRGKGKSFRGRGRSVLHSLEDLQLREKIESTRRKKKDGDEEDEDGEEEDYDEEEEEDEEDEGKAKDSGVFFERQPRDLPPDGSDEEDEAAPRKAKGVEGIIQIQNPNLAPKPKAARMKKLKDLRDVDALEDATPVEPMTRREREEMEKAKAKEEYFRRYKEGETDDAKRDMERLALVKQRREAAAKQREEEKRLAEEETDRIRQEAAAAESAVSDVEKLDPREIKKMNGKQLKDHLKERGLSLQGQKKELIDRLIAFETGEAST